VRRDGPAESLRGCSRGPNGGSLCATRSVPSSSSRSHHCTTWTGGSDCGPEGQRSAPSGSRRTATGVRNNRRVCSETVEDHDRRFWYRWPLTWRSSRVFTVLNTMQFLAGMPVQISHGGSPGVQIPSPPPLNRQVRASPTSSRRRSLHVAAAPRPQAQVTKEYGSSWIFEPCLACANALRRVQHPGISLVSSARSTACSRC